MEVVCPWSNTGSTFVESMDEDNDEISASEPDGARTNGHVQPQSQVGPLPATHLALHRPLHMTGSLNLAAAHQTLQPDNFGDCRALGYGHQLKQGGTMDQGTAHDASYPHGLESTQSNSQSPKHTMDIS